MNGYAIVNVGERFINVPTTYDSLSFGKLKSDNSLQPFQISVDKFDAKRHIRARVTEVSRLVQQHGA